MLPLAQQLQAGNFSAFAGARLNLSLPFSQQMLNEALAQAREGKDGPLKEIQLEIQAANQVQVRLVIQMFGLSKSLSFDLHIEPNLGFPASPRLQLALPSAHPLLGKVLEILTSSFGLLPGGIAIVERVITVDLTQAIEGGAPTPEEQATARTFLSLIKRGEIQTQAGKLILNLQMEVDEPGQTSKY